MSYNNSWLSPEYLEKDRRSGRTTMLALNTVHLILDNPGVEVKIDDHLESTIKGDLHLFELVRRVLDALQVPHTANKSRLFIRADGPPQPYRYPTAEDAIQKYHSDQQRMRRF